MGHLFLMGLHRAFIWKSFGATAHVDDELAGKERKKLPPA
jgi:hypothetical protein